MGVGKVCGGHVCRAARVLGDGFDCKWLWNRRGIGVSMSGQVTKKRRLEPGCVEHVGYERVMLQAKLDPVGIEVLRS